MGGNASPTRWGRLVPEYHRLDEDRARRASLILACTACLGGVCWLFSAYYWIQGVPALVPGLALLGLMQLLTPITFRLTRSLELVAQLVIVTCFFGVFAAAWFTGGPSSVGMVWAITIPTLGLLLSGWRSAVAWTILTTSALAGFGFVEAAGLEFPQVSNDLPHGFRNLVSNGALLACIFALLAVAEASRRRAQVRLQAANLELERARDAALAQARQKSEFLATVSHEIRTPMNAVIGLSELLLSSPLSEAQRGFARTIRTSSHELLRLIDDVLCFARNEAQGRVPQNLAWIDLGELVENVLDLLAEPAHRKGLELWPHLELTAGRRVKTDATRLRQILVNLLGNAIKFTEEGEVTLHVHPVARTGGRSRLRFEVRDTGVGLQEGETNVFRPFARSSGSTQKVEGTGLGLSISKQLVELMGGQIGAENRPEGGASFWFELELETEPERSSSEGEFAGAPVLVLEPTPSGRSSLSLALKRLGVPHDVASCLDEAPELGRRRGYRTVITRYEDVGFAHPEGARLERDPRLMGAQFILLARVSQTIDEYAGLLGGRALVLGRPIRSLELEAALARPRPAPAPGALGPVGPSVRPGMNILIVDDNPVNRQVLELQLGALGHHTTQASSGEAGLLAFDRSRFDAVFMDCHMPGMGGIEAIRRLRTLDGRGGSRALVVALTASIVDELWVRCMAAGADDVIAKPVELATLRRALERGAKAPPSERRVQAG